MSSNLTGKILDFFIYIFLMQQKTRKKNEKRIKTQTKSTHQLLKRSEQI